MPIAFHLIQQWRYHRKKVVRHQNLKNQKILIEIDKAGIFLFVWCLYMNICLSNVQ